jgi:ABC-type amino acid transport substrate-binding protein
VSSTKLDTPEKAAPVQSGGTLANILASGVVRVSVQNPSKPFYYQDNRGIAKGFNVDFMKALFAQSEFGSREIKLDTAHEVDAYEKVPQQLLQGTAVDIAIDGLTFNDDDLKGVAYSIPYVKDFGYALIAQNNSSVTSVDSANGKTIGVLKGDPDAMAFAKRTFPKSRLVELSDKADANGKWIVGYIDSHQVDAVIYDYPFAVAELEGTDLQFVSPKIAGSNIEYKIGVRAGDKDLLAALNSAIRKVTASDAYPEMLKAYFMSNKVAAVRSAKGNETVYVVVRGDTLSTIAQTHLGDKMRYPEIQSRNNLANPNFIAVGQKLVIPK